MLRQNRCLWLQFASLLAGVIIVTWAENCPADLWTTVHEIDFSAGDNPGSEWSPDAPVATLEVLGTGRTGPFVRDSELRVLGPFADDPITNEYDAGVDLSLMGIPAHEKMQANFALALFDVGQTGDEPDGALSGTYTPRSDPANSLTPFAQENEISGTADLMFVGGLETLVDGEQTPTLIYEMVARLPNVGGSVILPLPPLGNDVFDRTRTPPEPGWQWGVLTAEVDVQSSQSVVPEPKAAGLFGIGLACLIGYITFVSRRRFHQELAC